LPSAPAPFRSQRGEDRFLVDARCLWLRVLTGKLRPPFGGLFGVALARLGGVSGVVELYNPLAGLLHTLFQRLGFVFHLVVAHQKEGFGLIKFTLPRK